MSEEKLYDEIITLKKENHRLRLELDRFKRAFAQTQEREGMR